MTQNLLPEKTNVEKGITTVTVAPPDRTVTEDEAIEAMRRQGAVVSQPKVLSDLESIGIYVRGAGVLKIQRGRAIIVQQRLEELMRELATRAHEVTKDGKKIKLSELTKIANAVGYLSSKQTESQRLMIDLEGSLVPSGSSLHEPEPNMPSVPPGMPVRPAAPGTTQVFAQEAHFHGVPPEDKKPVNPGS